MDENIKKLYEAYVDAGKALFNALKPTTDEIKFVNEELLDIGMEDLLCHPNAPEEGGDVGLLAVNVYEYREAEEALDDPTPEEQ